MSESEAKILPPTPRKLRQARERGEIAKSKELVTAAVTAAGCMTLLIVFPHAIARFADAFLIAASVEQGPVTEGSGLVVRQLGMIAVSIIGPLLLLQVASALAASIVSNGGMTLSMQPLTPKLERLDPIKGIGRLFKVRSLVDLVKTVAKLFVVATICSFLLRDELKSLVQLPVCGLSCIPDVVHSAILPLIVTCCIAFLLVGLLDIGLQRWLYRRDMRMTQTEHKRDRKDSVGDPKLLARRRQERRDAALLGGRSGLKHATFVVHSSETALAFRFTRPETPVPVLVARGRKETCNRLVQEAGRKGLPIVFNPEAVALINERVEVGKMIPQAAFGPVIQCMKTAGVI